MKRAFFFFILLVLFVSCHEQPQQSAVDPLPFPIDVYKDTTVSPGDDFFQYCNGKWYDETPVPSDKTVGGPYDAIVAMEQRVSEFTGTNPAMKAFFAALDNMYAKPAESMAFIEARQAAIPKPQTYEEAFVTLGQMLADGFALPSLDLQMVNEEGRLVGVFHLSESTSQQVNERASLRVNEWIPAAQVSEQLPVFDCLLQGMGVDKQYVSVANQKTREALEALSDLSLDELYAMMQNMWKDLYLFVSEEKLAEYNTINHTSETPQVAKMEGRTSVNYVFSYHFAQTYLNDALKQKYENVVKELYQTFFRRMSRVEWMSETTRNNALYKLDKMQIFVGYPDQWYTDYLPDLTQCNTFVEMEYLLNRCTQRALLSTLGTQDFFTVFITSHTNVSETERIDYDLSFPNACYIDFYNSFVIYPFYLLPPKNEEGVSEALIYANFTVAGHEMTHGFDTNGSQLDAFGQRENWWTVTDKMEFEERTKLLIDCYNHLQMDPKNMPTQYGCGDRTISEDVADLGGFLIVLETYEAHLKKQGYFGEEYLKQLRRFYEGYADSWRVKYDPKKLNNIIKVDVHSHARLRVNGVVMNTDLWYDLYNVDRDNILYLPKERRAYIW